LTLLCFRWNDLKKKGKEKEERRKKERKKEERGFIY
jgi:hypothetical protein